MKLTAIVSSSSRHLHGPVPVGKLPNTTELAVAPSDGGTCSQFLGRIRVGVSMEGHLKCLSFNTFCCGAVLYTSKACCIRSDQHSSRLAHRYRALPEPELKSDHTAVKTQGTCSVRCFVQTMEPRNFTCGKDAQGLSPKRWSQLAPREAEEGPGVSGGVCCVDNSCCFQSCPSVGRQTCNAPSGVANALEPSCAEACGFQIVSLFLTRKTEVREVIYLAQGGRSFRTQVRHTVVRHASNIAQSFAS